MRIEYDYTSEDYVRVLERIYVNSPTARTKMWGLYLTITLISIATAFVQAMIWGWFYWPVYGAYVVLLPVYAVHLEKERTQEQISDSRNEAQKRGRFGRWTLILDADGTVRECGIVKEEWQWEAISRVETNGADVVFHLDGANIIIVPASAFANDVDRHTFLDEVMKYREQAAGIDNPS